MHPFRIFVVYLLFGSHAYGQAEVSLYGQAAIAHAVVSDNSGPLEADPSARSFGANGVRITWWQNRQIGFAMDYAAGAGSGTVSEDNVPDHEPRLTFRAMRRWNSDAGVLSPYVAAGVGIGLANTASPTEVNSLHGGLADPELLWAAGASLTVTDGFSVFGEISQLYGRAPMTSGVGGSGPRMDVGVTFGF